MNILQMILPVRQKLRITKGAFLVFLFLLFSDFSQFFLFLLFSDFRLGLLTYMPHNKLDLNVRLNRDKSFYHVEKLELQRRK